MKMNNLLVDVNIFSLCHKETLFQAEFQHLVKFSFLANKFLIDIFWWWGGGGGALSVFFFGMGRLRGICLGIYVQGLFVREVSPRTYLDRLIMFRKCSF